MADKQIEICRDEMKKTLGEIFEIGSGGTPSKNHAEYYGGDIPWVKTGDLKEEYLYFVEDYITEAGLKNSSAKMYSEGTVLIAMYGATIGATSVLKFDACTNQACAAFKPCKDVLPEYLYYFLRNKRREFINDGVGGAQPNISAGYLKKVVFDVRPLDEQKIIVTLLDKANQQIISRQHEIELLDDLIKARFVEMFGDININDKSWDSYPLGDLCTIVRGGSPRPIENYLGGDVPWIKIGDATDGDNIYLKSTKEHIIQEGVRKSRLVKKGSLIFANCGVSLGFARIITFEGCIHDGWLAMEDIDERLDKVFLLQSLNQMTEHFRAIAPAGTQPNLNTAIMKSYNQIVPPKALQLEYISFLKQVDKSKSVVQKSLDETKILFDSLLQEYFS